MKRLLDDIRSGAFAREYVEEGRSGLKTLLAKREEWKHHQIEKVGDMLRSMMNWIGDKPLVDKDKN